MNRLQGISVTATFPSIGPWLLALGCPPDVFQAFRKSFLTSIRQTQRCILINRTSWVFGGTSHLPKNQSPSRRWGWKENLHFSRKTSPLIHVRIKTFQMHLQMKGDPTKKCEKGGWVGDFELQPLSTSVQNLLNSQIKLCFILRRRNHVAYMIIDEHVDNKALRL